MKENISKRLGELIAEEREAHGQSLETLADRTGVAVPTLRRLEAGDIAPGALDLLVVADELEALDGIVAMVRRSFGSSPSSEVATG